MDDVELECRNLLQDLGIPLKPPSPPPAPELSSYSSEKRELADEPARESSEEMAKARSRSSERTIGRAGREETSSSSRRGMSRSPDYPNSGSSSYPRDRWEKGDISELGGTGYDPHALFLADLDPRIRQSELQALFSRFGEVLDIRIRSPKKKVFAFVEFKDTAHAARAFEEMNDTLIGSRRARISYAEDRPAPPPSTSAPVASDHVSFTSTRATGDRPTGARALRGVPQSLSPVATGSTPRNPSLQDDELFRTLICQNLPPFPRTTELKIHLRGSDHAQIRIKRAYDRQSAAARLIFDTRRAAQPVQKLNGIIIGGRRVLITFDDGFFASLFDSQDTVWSSAEGKRW